VIEVAVGKTANRSFVGAMNEFSVLADTLCSPIRYNSPARLLKELFGDALR
jgi:hypothetical protein